MKKGRRHRYYTSRATLRRAKEQPPITRISADPLEKLVIDRIMSFLKSPQELSCLGGGDSNVAALRKLINVAGLKAAQLEDVPGDEIEQFVRRIVEHIVVREAAIDIHVHRGSLDRLILGQPREESSAEPVVLSSTIRCSRPGADLRLVIDAEQTADADSPELKDMARAQQWLTLVLNGECAIYEDLGKSAGLHPRYISLVLKRGTVISRKMLE